MPDQFNVGAISRLQAARSSLSGAEQQIADWIIARPADALDMSMAAIAKTCGVSDTTVLRTARAAGFAGFTELKLRLAQDLATPSQLIHEDVIAKDSPSTVAHKVFGAAIQSLKYTAENLDPTEFSAALDLLTAAESIVIGAVGTSAVAAQAFYQRCRRVGLACDAPQDSQLQITHASLLGPGGLAIGISNSGATKAIAQFLHAARNRGAATIAVTGNIDSPVAEHADVILQTVTRETRSEPLAARACQLTVLDALYVSYSLQNIDRVIELEHRAIDAISAHTY